VWDIKTGVGEGVKIGAANDWNCWDVFCRFAGIDSNEGCFRSILWFGGKCVFLYSEATATTPSFTPTAARHSREKHGCTVDTIFVTLLNMIELSSVS
jgi:hypothetical protein